jgi:hypothetical protein
MAAVVLAWDFNGNTGSEATVNATTNNLSPTLVAVSRGSGLNGNNYSNSFNSNDFEVGGIILGAATNGDFLQFNFTVPTNTVLSLSGIDVNFRRSGTGPNNFLWQYSVGSGFNDIGSVLSFTNTATNGVAQPTINLSGIGSLQSMVSGTNVTFRLLGAGATGSTGAFSLGRLSGNDLVLNGTVTAVPEPSSLASGLALLTLFAFVKIRRSGLRATRERLIASRSISLA